MRSEKKTHRRRDRQRGRRKDRLTIATTLHNEIHYIIGHTYREFIHVPKVLIINFRLSIKFFTWFLQAHILSSLILHYICLFVYHFSPHISHRLLRLLLITAAAAVLIQISWKKIIFSIQISRLLSLILGICYYIFERIIFWCAVI